VTQKNTPTPSEYDYIHVPPSKTAPLSWMLNFQFFSEMAELTLIINQSKFKAIALQIGMLISYLQSIPCRTTINEIIKEGWNIYRNFKIIGGCSKLLRGVYNVSNERIGYFSYA
jgi:hypothetical protein